MKPEARIRILLYIPCGVAIILAVSYLLCLLPSAFLNAVNALFIPLFLIETAYACSEKNNIRKFWGSISAVTIGGIALALNTPASSSAPFLLSQLSNWFWLWSVLLILSLAGLLVILIRLINWDQEQWEEIRQARQAYRKERFAHIRNLCKTRRENTQILLSQKAKDKFDKQRDKASKGKAIRDQRHELQMKQIAEGKKIWGIGSVRTTITSVCAIVILIGTVGLFLAIPYSISLWQTAINWFKAVEDLADQISLFSLFGIQRKTGFFAAFSSYIMTYLAIIAAAYLISLLCKYIYHGITNTKASRSSNDRETFLEKYDTPIAVLVVATSVLFSIGAGILSISGFTGGGISLLTIILFILLVFASVEIVRLVIEQIGQENSLLKLSIRLIFTALLEFFLGLLLGIITNFHIEKVVSSLFTLIFPENEVGFTIKAQKRLQDIFNREVDVGEQSTDAHFSFRTKQIWRRSKNK